LAVTRNEARKATQNAVPRCDLDMTCPLTKSRISTTIAGSNEHFKNKMRIHHARQSLCTEAPD
jgi:hypothetical protein